MKTRLSVNINKLATLRNARGKNNPNLISFAKKIVEWGAEGITVHPRPDKRHILYDDVFKLKEFLKSYQQVEFNIEGYPSENFLNLIKKVRPHQCTLVPDAPHVLTSDAGWDFKANESLLVKILGELKPICPVSLFLDPLSMTQKEWNSLSHLSPHRVELYTEQYATAWGTKKQKEILMKYKTASKKAEQLGIEVNAGHDLNQKNLHDFLIHVEVREVSIGHALICEALIEGLETTIKNYLNLTKNIRKL